MNLQETIKRILREEREISTQLLRRLNFDILDKGFNDALNISSIRYVKHIDKWNNMTLEKFKNMVISMMMDDVFFKIVGYDESYDSLFDEIFEFLMEYYSSDMEKTYRFFQIGKLPNNKTRGEQNESELTEKCWKGYTQKGMKTMFGSKITIKLENFSTSRLSLKLFK